MKEPEGRLASLLFLMIGTRSPTQVFNEAPVSKQQRENCDDDLEDMQPLREEVGFTFLRTPWF